jgi:pimeloyl-ACP methyl ester carboxylesterase
MEIDRPFYAIDLPGHGLSEHRPEACTYHLIENIVDVIAFINALENAAETNEAVSSADAGDSSISNNSVSISNKVSLLGHSLGGIIACLLAAGAPERVDQLILLDSMGPLTDETENVLPQLRNAVAKAAKINSNVTVFPSLDMAVRARMAGIGKLSREASERLVKRGIKKVAGGYSWCSDPKLLKPSFLRLSESQVEVIFSGIECPVKLITGTQGYFSNAQALEKRMRYFKNIEHVNVQGGHHFHMDGDIESTARYINGFI